MTPEPTEHDPSRLSTHKPARQASIRPKKTGFGQIHAHKEPVCLVAELCFVNSEGDYDLHVIECYMPLDGRTARCTRT